MRTSFALLLTCLCLPGTALSDSQGLDVGLELAKHTTDFNYSGDVRETRLTRLGLSWNEKLAESIRGGIELGYIEFTQYSNPIAAGQTGSGEYLGLHLSFIMVESRHFDLLTRLDYRYHALRHSTDDQTMDWDWHEGRAGIYSNLRFTDNLALFLGASALTIDGREVASGTVNQAQPFKADTPNSGHVGLNLGLDHAGTIGIEIDVGSVRGGRLSFRQIF
jgi:hypothetical protein